MNGLKAKLHVDMSELLTCLKRNDLLTKPKVKLKITSIGKAEFEVKAQILQL